MNGDGFAVKTTIAQMGNVARSQLKAQQVHNSGPEHGKKPGEKESRIEKLREAEDAQKAKVDPDRSREDGQRRRGREQPTDESETNDEQRDPDGTEAIIGLRIDIKA